MTDPITIADVIREMHRLDERITRQETVERRPTGGQAVLKMLDRTIDEMNQRMDELEAKGAK